MPTKILLVAGARPQFIKSAPLVAALTASGADVRILHTGQHYDAVMSQVFFDELGIPEPEWNLGCGGGSHGAMTGAMLEGIERVLLECRPAMCIVPGDTNSTLAGALAAAKLHIPVAHVEAGLRSHNRRMPEELNRICTDHLSDLLFCSSESGKRQLAAEGITRGVHVCGDLMADLFHSARERASRSPFRPAPGGPWALLTLHRQENTEAPERMRAIFHALNSWSRPVVFPVHPRTRDRLAQTGIEVPANVQCCDPLGYMDMMAALLSCERVLTDSGGLQKEALWAGRPCITLRDETEWVESVACGWNTVAGADTSLILQALARPAPPGSPPSLYGDGHSAARMTEIMLHYLHES